MECVHSTAGGSYGTKNVSIAGNRFLSCPVESFYAEGGQQNGLLIENNYFDGASNMEIGCDVPNCDFQNITVRFNSFHGAGWLPENAAQAGTAANFTGGKFYGNLGNNICVPIYISHAGATNTGGFAGTYNVTNGVMAGVCNGNPSNAFSVAINWVSPGSSNYNLDLNGVQTATGFVPSSVTPWPAANIYGIVRTGGSTNAGAN
jgi:hypothetical protein